ncbi:hypothetical protein EDC01DRAFT_633529 [Geopyxis carbonaria]|nr:hypothetical protein EDC01DRAFT_633529 [Geopyxis carbonaria]
MPDKLYPLLQLPKIPADSDRKDVSKLEYFFLQEHFGWSAAGWWIARLMLYLIFWLKHGPTAKMWWEKLKQGLKLAEAGSFILKCCGMFWDKLNQLFGEGKRIMREWWKGKAKKDDVPAGDRQGDIEMTILNPKTPMVL